MRDTTKEVITLCEDLDPYSIEHLIRVLLEGHYNTSEITRHHTYQKAGYLAETITQVKPSNHLENLVHEYKGPYMRRKIFELDSMLYGTEIYELLIGPENDLERKWGVTPGIKGLYLLHQMETPENKTAKEIVRYLSSKDPREYYAAAELLTRRFNTEIVYSAFDKTVNKKYVQKAVFLQEMMNSAGYPTISPLVMTNPDISPIALVEGFDVGEFISEIHKKYKVSTTLTQEELKENMR